MIDCNHYSAIPMHYAHPASHVTLLMSGGKFASGADISGGRFLSFRGALFFPQGGAYFFSGGPFFPDEKRTAKFRGASAPLNEKCMPHDVLMQDQFVQ